jgi:DNA (cytosine-5)-methyltransferase 1
MAATATLGPLNGLTAQQVNDRFLKLIASQEWGAATGLDDLVYSTLVSQLYAAPRLFTYIDLFCGAGGSSIGLTAAGGQLLLGANHSKRAIETHSKNFADAEHECADINHYDMRKLPRGAHVLWASPICTEISPAGGKRRKGKGNPLQQELLAFGAVKKEEFERTRATFHDVIRAAEIHRFPYVLVENVVEVVTDWELFAWWLDGMVLLGYEYQIVCVSAAHVGGDVNPHAPQRRDRVYIVFNRKDCAKPDVEPRPLSHCGTCGDVQGVQVWKRPEGTMTESGRRFMVGKYGPRTGQYFYMCPNAACGQAMVTPYERPAAAVIDWDDLGVRIGDREAAGLAPLAEATMRRIRRGFDMFARPIVATVAGNTYERPGSDYVRAWPADLSPFMARTTTGSDALAVPPVLVNSAHNDDRAYPVDGSPFPARTVKIGDGLACPPFFDTPGGSWNRGTLAPVAEAFRTRTTREWEALVVPPGAFIETKRNNTVPTSAWEPLTAVTAGGNHHGLVIPYNRTGVPSPTVQPFPTQTTRDRCGLARGGDGAQLDIMEAFYRMVSWQEQARAQRFPSFYEITGNKGECTAQAGNAVACNVAQWLGQRVGEALNRTAATV